MGHYVLPRALVDALTPTLTTRLQKGVVRHVKPHDGMKPDSLLL
jgi:hypothetical protein